MKNISFVDSNPTAQIRQNRLNIRNKLKLNINPHQKKQKIDPNTDSDVLQPNKTQSHVKVLNQVGLVQKQFIQGSFQDAYQLKQKIGEGAHATVYKCLDKTTGKIYAVKITKQGDEELIESSKVQFKILKNLDHENIMKAEAFYTDRTKMTTYLVCQLCDFPELAVHLRNRNENSISQSQATTIITSILQALQYLHTNGVCHRDIKPENVLYNPETKKIKLIDFDCAKLKRQTDSKMEMWTKTGSLHYQAPQYFNSIVYSEKVDIWALGVIAYELVTRNLPFRSNYYHRIVKMITQDQIRVDHLNVSEDFKNLLKKILERDSTKRYSASQCLRLPLILKGEQHHVVQTQDDFNIDLWSPTPDSPRSSTNIMNHRNSQMCIHRRRFEQKPILKYFCFVSEL